MAVVKLINVELVKPTLEAPNLTPDDSWLLSSGSTYRIDLITGFADSELDTSKLGEHFPDIRPVRDNVYEIELGVSLPDLLPNLNKKQDYNIDVSIENRAQRVSISNRMRQFHFTKEQVTYLCLYPFGGESSIQKNLGVDLKTNPPIQLRSTVTARFHIDGDSAHDALAENIERCLQEFTSCLNKILSECKMLDFNLYSYFSPAYHQTTFSWFYLLMGGKNGAAQCRIVPHAGKVAFIAQNFNLEQENALRDQLKRASGLDPRRILMAARSSEQGGLSQFALLQAVIASEVATAHYVKEQLLKRGLSKNKWDAFKAGITYSQMLNIYLVALTPPESKPDLNLIGVLNRARALRNSLMHEGEDEIGNGELVAILNSTFKYIEYLDSLSRD